MADRRDLFTLTIVKYTEAGFGWRWLGKGRRALDIGSISFIFEYWGNRP